MSEAVLVSVTAVWALRAVAVVSAPEDVSVTTGNRVSVLLGVSAAVLVSVTAVWALRAVAVASDAVLVSVTALCAVCNAVAVSAPVLVSVTAGRIVGKLESASAPDAVSVKPEGTPRAAVITSEAVADSITVLMSYERPQAVWPHEPEPQPATNYPSYAAVRLNV